VETYWQIGKIIIEDEQEGNQKAFYGKETILETITYNLNSRELQRQINSFVFEFLGLIRDGMFFGELKLPIK
jgi:hypothetical protein